EINHHTHLLSPNAAHAGACTWLTTAHQLASVRVSLQLSPRMPAYGQLKFHMTPIYVVWFAKIAGFYLLLFLDQLTHFVLAPRRYLSSLKTDDSWSVSGLRCRFAFVAEAALHSRFDIAAAFVIAVQFCLCFGALLPIIWRPH